MIKSFHVTISSEDCHHQGGKRAEGWLMEVLGAHCGGEPAPIRGIRCAAICIVMRPVIVRFVIKAQSTGPIAPEPSLAFSFFFALSCSWSGSGRKAGA